MLIERPSTPATCPASFSNRQDTAHAAVQAIGAPNLKVQMDLYHCQIMEGNVATKIRQKYLPTGRRGMFRMAGVPERRDHRWAS